ncbi:MAG: hypothetical protein Edafosvirus8_9 [Edafosvirus sp.]|uniref:Uncharacterized protein n=1 Tax=Edafosvirus sp. TaxID=2487765 RepID=A0A3G4ZXY4_9VIRU|nr:MAG: hypothetical protein Edafosvirus8_9 [Edafosvirus sp.]
MTHFYERNIVEIKSEYTTFLTNIITPLIYEGIKSIYDKASKLNDKFNDKAKSDPNVEVPGILKIFQICLKDISSLNNHEIELEMNRIKEKSKCSDIFDDLIKAVVKSNIVLLTFNASGKHCQLVNDKYHEKIDTKNFIHKCYIECARIFYNNPDLFWHEFTTLDIKRNQRESYELIKIAIAEAIRKMLPIKLILEEYLKNDYIQEDNNITVTVTESQYGNVKSMINKDLYNNHESGLVSTGGDTNTNSNSNYRHRESDSEINYFRESENVDSTDSDNDEKIKENMDLVTEKIDEIKPIGIDQTGHLIVKQPETGVTTKPTENLKEVGQPNTQTVVPTNIVKVDDTKLHDGGKKEVSKKEDSKKEASKKESLEKDSNKNYIDAPPAFKLKKDQVFKNFTNEHKEKLKGTINENPKKSVIEPIKNKPVNKNDNDKNDSDAMVNISIDRSMNKSINGSDESKFFRKYMK